jgi:hypothetical protein
MTGTSVFFEALLAVATGVAVVRLWRARWRACAFALSFVGLAAALGAALFAGFMTVDASHALVTRWAAVAGFPAFGGFGLWRQFRNEPAWPLPLLVIVLLGLLGAFIPGATYPLLIGSLGLFCLLLVAAVRIHSAPLDAATLFAACLLTALAGLLIGTEGQWGPLPRVDWYHLALSTANLGFGFALVRRRAPARPATSN